MTERDFKGIWIPKVLWFTEELTLQEKILLLEIDSLDNERGCFASNGHLGKIVQCHPKSISRSIAALKKKGLIHDRDSTDEQRTLRVTLAGLRVMGKAATPKPDVTPPRNSALPPPQPIVTQSNTVSNKEKPLILFDDFWDLYDKKHDRAKCEKKWDHLPGRDRIAIMAHMPLYVMATPEKKFRKNPATYLNNRTWEDEQLPVADSPRPNGQTPKNRRSAQERRNLLTAAEIQASSERTIANIESGRPLFDF